MPEDRLPTENEIWHYLHDYFRQYGLVRHQIESYDHFMHVMLPQIVQEAAAIRVRQGDDEEHVVSLCNLSVHRPAIADADGVERDLLPVAARLRGATYAAAVLVDVVHDVHRAGAHVERRLFRETCLCRLPVMLGSACCHTRAGSGETRECHLDHGGYFIVSGCEKVLIAQEKLHHNTPYVFPVKQPSRFALQCEMRSCNERKLRSTSSLYLFVTAPKRGTSAEMVATLPFVEAHVSVLALFRLLGVPTRQAVVELILGGDEAAPEHRLLCSMLDADATADLTLDELYEHVGKLGTREATRERRQRYLDHIVNCEVLPHMGLQRDDDTLRGKALCLGLMVRRLARVHLGLARCDDRDHYAAKRVDCAGVQFALLFRQVFRSVYKSLASQLFRLAEQRKLAFTNVGDLVAGKKISQAFRYALATGNWGLHTPRAPPSATQNGVAQQLGRMTIPATLALLRKVATPVARETKNPQPRQLHPTSWGLVCPMDTPEGAACGLSRSLAMMAHVRVGTRSDATRDELALLAARRAPGCTRRARGRGGGAAACPCSSTASSSSSPRTAPRPRGSRRRCAARQAQRLPFGATSRASTASCASTPTRAACSARCCASRR